MHCTKLIFRKTNINRPRAAIFIKFKILNILNLSWMPGVANRRRPASQPRTPRNNITRKY